MERTLLMHGAELGCSRWTLRGARSVFRRKTSIERKRCARTSFLRNCTDWIFVSAPRAAAVKLAMSGLIATRQAMRRLSTRTVRGTTLCDLLFRTLCQSRGLQTGNRKKPWLRKVVASIWILIHLLGSVIFSKSATDRIRGFDFESFSYFTKIASVTLFMCTELFSAIRFFSMSDQIQALLQESRRRPQDFLVNLTCFALLSLKYVHLTFYDAETLPLKAYFRLAEFSRWCFFMIYNDVIINFQNIQKDILDHAENIAMNDEEILRKKWNLRKSIQGVNGMFSWFLAVYHLQIFMSAVRAAINFLDPAYTHLDRAIIIVGKIAIIFQLFDFARKSSRLKRSCVEIEQSFSAAIQEGALDRNDLGKMLLVMRLHEDLDTLRNGCYALETEKFMSFLTTSAMCTAVVLQFDFRIVRAIANLGESS